MASSKIEQQLIDTVKGLESNLKSAYSELARRLNKLEERSGLQEHSPDSSDAELSPEKRREIVDEMYETQFLQVNEFGKYKISETEHPYMPMCRTCQHATPLDGEIMQYNNETLKPFFTYSGFIVCSKLGSQFPLRAGPKRNCALMEPDGGKQPDTKNPIPEPI